jgi:hypothetical protein
VVGDAVLVDERVELLLLRDVGTFPRSFDADLP